MGVLVAHLAREIEWTGQNELDRSEALSCRSSRPAQFNDSFSISGQGLKGQLFGSRSTVFHRIGRMCKHGTLESHTNIMVEAAGLYVIVSICGQCVLKVGQTGNFRERFSNGHLRYGYDATASKLIDFCNAVPESEES